jgi:hypothetical protein
MKTPREELENLSKLNSSEGFYGIHNQFSEIIRKRISDKAILVMKSLNVGFIWINERKVYDDIYNLLLDGKSIKHIKIKYKTF